MASKCASNKAMPESHLLTKLCLIWWNVENRPANFRLKVAIVVWFRDIEEKWTIRLEPNRRPWFRR